MSSVAKMSLSSKYVPRVRMWKAPHENEAIQYCLAQGWDSRMLDGKAGRKLMYQALEDQAANPSIHGTFYKAYGGEIPNKKMEQFYKNFRRAISRFETTVAANDDSTRAKCRGVPTNNKMGPVDTPDKKSNADDLELTPKTQETKEASLASARKSQVAAERAILNQNAEKYVPLTTHTASVSMSSIQMSSSGVNASGKGPNDWCDPQNQKIQELVDSGDLTYDDVKHIAGNGKHNREASKLLNHIRHDYPELYGDFSATQFNENVRNMLFSIGKENNTPMKSRTMETESEDSEEEMSLTTKRMKLVDRNRRKASKKAEVHAKFFAANRSMFDEVGDRLGQTLEKFEDFGKHMNVISVHLGNLLDAVRQSIDLASKQLGELSALRQIAAASNERAHDLFHKQCQNQWAYEEAKLESEFAAEDLAEHEAREQAKTKKAENNTRAGKAAAEEGLDDEEDNRKLSPMKNGNRSTRSSGRGGGYVGINYTRGAMGRAAISTPKSKAGATSSNSTRSTAIKRTRTLDGFHSELPVEVANKKNKVSSSAKEPAAKKASEKK